MKMKLFGLFEVECDPVELAIFTMTLLDIFKAKQEYDEAHKEMSTNEMLEELLKAYGDTTFEELFKKEPKEDDEST